MENFLVKKNINHISKEYIKFLNRCKTEREVVFDIKDFLDKNDFINIEEKEKLKPGDKVYYINNEKSMYIAVIGEGSIFEGINIIGSHVDSPRIDLRPNPLYSKSGLGLFKTHYYGGIKKYQWTTIPLSLHGVIYDSKGEKRILKIGEKEQDPVFTITDLLPHLAEKQMEKPLKEAIRRRGFKRINWKR